eukprot:TRINITY_DN45332_c0_g3_i1.p1 TRINITY_DN45332_c0_g3~~TRINITY_DN45332_c0_g3_i1.p1  ORF type:complete len:561 (+),score=198.97 TRINITY_DN45332_c0_g3_i1:114-1796(+)
MCIRDRYDHDHNGELDAGELEIMALAKARSRHDQALLDTNQDGELDKDEWRRGGGKQEDFDRYDYDASDTLDGTELELMSGAKAKAARDLKALDSNTDGLVSRPEWQAAGRGREEFDRYDFDESGALDRDELEHMAAAKARACVLGRQMDSNHDGAVDEQEFKQGGGGERFGRYDKDMSGELDQQELELMQAAQSKAGQQMRRMDRNRDGAVDKQEFSAAGQRETDFELYDVDETGTLDQAELEARVLAKAEARAMRGAMDEDGDGMVDRQEYKSKGGRGKRFDLFDGDANGKLDPRELELMAMAGGVVRDELNVLDADRDGAVSEQEWTAAGKQQREFDRFDLNKDGLLDQDELALKAVTQAKVRQMRASMEGGALMDREEFEAAGEQAELFDGCDLDQDGRLDVAELELMHLAQSEARAAARHHQHEEHPAALPWDHDALPDTQAQEQPADVAAAIVPQSSQRAGTQFDPWLPARSSPRPGVRRCTTLPRRESRTGSWNSSTNTHSAASPARPKLGLPRSNQFLSSPRPLGQSVRRSGPQRGYTVSYTHLTLPTKRIV